MALKRLLKIPLPGLRFERGCHVKSSLFVSGQHLSGFAPPVFPDLDIEEYLNKQDMNENLKMRSIDRSFDPEGYLKVAKRFRELDCGYEKLSSQLKDAYNEEKAATGTPMGKTIEELKKQTKQLTLDRWNLEENYLYDYFQLPNRLHPDVKINDVVLDTFGNCVKRSESHIDIATKLLELEASSNGDSAFYLLGRLAELELHLCKKSQDFLLEAGCEEAACPDFTRTFIIEGCEPTFLKNPGSFLCMASTKDFGTPESGMGLHLTGGASLFSFLGLFVKHVVSNPKSLPATLFCIGRQYKILDSTQKIFSLFNTRQSTAVQIFDVAKNESEMSTQFEKWTAKMKVFFGDLNVAYRIVKKSASKLSHSESFSLSFEMFSPSLGVFIEVGNLSMYDDYLSKRLMLKYEDGGDLENLFVTSGTFLNVTKAIGCIIEQTEGKL